MTETLRAPASVLSIRLRLSALLLACAVACGGEAAPGDGGTGGDGGLPIEGDGAVEDDKPKPPLEVKPGGLALRVDQARRVSNDGTWGSLEIAFTLANGEGAPAASLAFTQFQVKTSAGLYVNAGSGSTYWVKGDLCNPSLSVGGDATFSCTLSVTLEGTDVPTELYYRTPNKVAGVGEDQRSATAEFTVEACSPCATDCTYIDRDSENCGACGQVVQLTDGNGSSVSGSCEGGKPACAEEGVTLCDTRCVVLTDSRTDCGKCGATVFNGSCVNGAPMCEGTTTTISCGDDTCVDTTRNLYHCGGCDKSCWDKNPEGSPSCEVILDGKPSACTDYVYFNTAEGDVLTPGDTCADLCLKKAYGGCTDCGDFETPVGEGDTTRSCRCYWQP